MIQQRKAAHDVIKQQLCHVVTRNLFHVTVGDLAAPSGENTNCSTAVAVFVIII